MKLEEIYKKIEALDEALKETASASINMSGDTAEDVMKLMNALKGESPAKDIADIPTTIKKLEPMDKPMGPPMDPHDNMVSMMDIVKDKPEPMDMPMPGCEDEVAQEADYENEPDEKYQDQHYMTKDLSGGSEMGQKKSFPKVAGGDNPMALEDEIKAELSSKLAEFMKEAVCDKCDDDDCEGDCDEDRADEGKMPAGLKAYHDKKKGKKSDDKEDKEKTNEAKKDDKGKKVQLPSGKEMKKCKDDGMSKAEIMKKYTEMGCEGKQLEKLYAAHCM